MNIPAHESASYRECGESGRILQHLVEAERPRSSPAARLGVRRRVSVTQRPVSCRGRRGVHPHHVHHAARRLQTRLLAAELSLRHHQRLQNTQDFVLGRSDSQTGDTGLIKSHSVLSKTWVPDDIFFALLVPERWTFNKHSWDLSPKAIISPAGVFLCSTIKIEVHNSTKTTPSQGNCICFYSVAKNSNSALKAPRGPKVEINCHEKCSRTHPTISCTNCRQFTMFFCFVFFFSRFSAPPDIYNTSSFLTLAGALGHLFASWRGPSHL